MPCRRENKEILKPLYEQYHARGFEVFGVSQDESSEKIATALSIDNLPWDNVTDLLGNKSPIWTAYKIISLPTTYLVNEDYEVVGMDIRGEELKRFVAEYFKD